MPRCPAVSLLFLCASAIAVEPVPPDGSPAARKTVAALRLPAGFKAELFAAEPQLGSPVAIGIDEKGRVFVAEEYRFNRGTEENRSRPFLLDDDLQIRTLEDRLAVYRKYEAKFEGGMEWFRKHTDKVRLLEDRDGDGRADHSMVFAEGFDGVLDGLAAGVLPWNGDVYVTCIPNLWRLRDTDGDGKADVRETVHRGFGVNCAFLGHDLHGLAFGPDGRLYFSVGDRGYHVNTREGATLSGPRNGAVFRCDPDGRNLEVIHRGLRNPQELAFDEFGNLFADDNNCDKGDHARLVYIVEGGHSGWNMAFQTIPAPYLTGPWHAEKMWHLEGPGRPAWILPPAGKLGAGPSGFAFHSGTAMPDRYRNRFYMCNYTGNGGIECFGVKPKGAAYEIVDYHDFCKPVQATDIEFGFDGKIYISDFVKLNWDGSSAGGRIYTVFDPKRIAEADVAQIKKLFADGFAHRPTDELARLLSHADLRVRQRAQFALADKGAGDVFRSGLATPDRYARLHAIWGLWQLGRRDSKALEPLIALLGDADAEVRAQCAKVLGDCRYAPAAERLTPMLDDASSRVRFFAAIALGRLKHAPAIEPIFAMLRDNADADAHLRHAGVTALAGIGQSEAVWAHRTDASKAVRLAVLLVLRQWGDRRVDAFLTDAELDLVTEAARAIHDLEMDDRLEPLAAVLGRFGASKVSDDAEPLLRRAIAANQRLGAAVNLERVAAVVSNPNHSNTIRLEALAALADWVAPGPRDRVTGYWRPTPARQAEPVRRVLAARVPAILARSTGKLQTEAAKLIAKLNLPADDALFAGWIADEKRDASSRTAALALLAGRNSPTLGESLQVALASGEPRLRAAARETIAARQPDRAVTMLREVLDGSTAAVLEKQSALAVLAGLKSPAAAQVIDEWAFALAGGKVPATLQLDVLEAALAGSDKAKQAAANFESAATGDERIPGKFRVSLEGGDAGRGAELFTGHAAGQCIRCHTIAGNGGTAGPDLSKVVERNPKDTRVHVLESMILPNAKVAEGFGTVAVKRGDGTIVAGVLKSEDAKQIVLATPDGKTVTVPKDDIEDRAPPTSAMPAVDRALTRRELRDLVEYLANLKP